MTHSGILGTHHITRTAIIMTHISTHGTIRLTITLHITVITDMVITVLTTAITMTIRTGIIIITDTTMDMLTDIVQTMIMPLVQPTTGIAVRWADMAVEQVVHDLLQVETIMGEIPHRVLKLL